MNETETPTLWLNRWKCVNKCKTKQSFENYFQERKIRKIEAQQNGVQTLKLTWRNSNNNWQNIVTKLKNFSSFSLQSGSKMWLTNRPFYKMDIWIKIFVFAFLLCGLISGTEGEWFYLFAWTLCKLSDERRIPLRFFFGQMVCGFVWLC